MNRDSAGIIGRGAWCVALGEGDPVSERGGLVERAPPYSEEAEKGVLGAVLYDPARLLPLLRGEMKLSVESFYIPAHRCVWEVITALDNTRRPVDPLTVAEELRAAGRLDDAGGAVAVDRLVDACPTAAHGEYYAQIVRDKHQARRVLTVARQAEADVYGGASAAEAVSTAMAALEEIGNSVVPGARSNAEVLDALMENWVRAKDVRQNGDEFLPGLRTPYRRLNEILGGMQPGLHFFGGKSSAGKTTLVMNICAEFLAHGHGGLMIQLDDTHEDVIGRMVSMMSGVSLPALAQGFTRHEQLEKVRDEIRPMIASMNLHVVEECADIQEARNLGRFYKAKHGIEWVVIDYVQVLDADGNPRDDERQRLGKIAKGCKRMWKELRVPVLVVSQVSKFKDSEDDGMRADMADLFGASELFHAATSVLIAKQVRQRPGKNEKLALIEQAIDETGHTKRQAVALHVPKNKHGPKDSMVMLWALLKYFRFEETRWVHDKGIWRQLTWQEEMERDGG